MIVFKKNQKVWIIWPRQGSGLTDVEPATIAEITKDAGKICKIYVRKKVEFDGEIDEMVIDRPPDRIFKTEYDALQRASEICLEIAQKWNAKALELIKRRNELK